MDPDVHWYDSQETLSSVSDMAGLLHAKWPTLSLPALRVYNAFPLASVHSLDSVEITDSRGWNKKFKMRIKEQIKYNLDFLEMEYVRPTPWTPGPASPV